MVGRRYSGEEGRPPAPRPRRRSWPGLSCCSWSCNGRTYPSRYRRRLEPQVSAGSLAVLGHEPVVALPYHVDHAPLPGEVDGVSVGGVFQACPQACSLIQVRVALLIWFIRLTWMTRPVRESGSSGCAVRTCQRPQPATPFSGVAAPPPARFDVRRWMFELNPPSSRGGGRRHSDHG